MCHYIKVVGDSTSNEATQYVSVTLWGEIDPTSSSRYKCVSIKTSNNREMVYQSEECTMLHPYVYVGQNSDINSSSFPSTTSSVTNAISNGMSGTESSTFSSIEPSVINTTSNGTYITRPDHEMSKMFGSQSIIERPRNNNETTTEAEHTQCYSNATISTQHFTVYLLRQFQQKTH